ncbi:MAG: hypothetical protein HN392_09105 [Anaerolineae bacterium]|nr:hypothetical protein [Anaerolineae bacterium]
MMKSTKRIWLFALLVLLLMLTACGGQTVAEAEGAIEDSGAIDPEAIFTSAAATVGAQLTETAIAFSPTPEPPTLVPTLPATATLVDLGIATATLPAGVPTLIPTLTPISIAPTPGGPICDAMLYGSPLDINYPDGSELAPGEDFEKIWRIKNDGVCTWDSGYILVPVSSTSSRGDNNPLDAANPAFEIKTLVSPGQQVDVGAKLTAPLDIGEYSTCFIMENDRGVYFGGVLCVDIKVVK